MASMIQIFGTKKCSDTNKAIRFFKERGIKVQFIDLNEKEISKGELNSITRSIPLSDLIDIDGKQFKNRKLQYMVYDLEQELLKDPLLFKTPITRLANESALGNTPEIWKKWIEKVK
ncbi:MAG TPA: glutaredoxin domain-containing protein [Candidatus Kapabacteria bacterium]|nr:glutaredoxin domain-containing protein [Candidatus Kapabacteria bacterium]